MINKNLHKSLASRNRNEILIRNWNNPGIPPIEIGETLHRDIAKLFMRSVMNQEKMACGCLQLCAGLEAGIEGATHAMAQRQRERNELDIEGG